MSQKKQQSRAPSQHDPDARGNDSARNDTSTEEEPQSEGQISDRQAADRKRTPGSKRRVRTRARAAMALTPARQTVRETADQTLQSIVLEIIATLPSYATFPPEVDAEKEDVPLSKICRAVETK